MEMSCEMVLKTLLLSKYMTYAPSSFFYNTVAEFKDGNWMVLISLLYDKSSLTDCMFFYCQSNAHKEIIAQFIVLDFLHYMLNWLLCNSPSPGSPSLKTGTVFAILPSSGISSLLHELSWIITNESDCSDQCLKCSRGNFIQSC